MSENKLIRKGIDIYGFVESIMEEQNDIGLADDKNYNVWKSVEDFSQTITDEIDEYVRGDFYYEEEEGYENESYVM